MARNLTRNDGKSRCRISRCDGDKLPETIRLEDQLAILGDFDPKRIAGLKACYTRKEIGRLLNIKLALLKNFSAVGLLSQGTGQKPKRKSKIEVR